jgi:hypothetical protein
MRKICIRVKIRSNQAFLSSFPFTEFRLHPCKKLELRESAFPFPFTKVYGLQLTQSYSFWTHEKWDGHGILHEWGRRKMHRVFGCGNMKKRDHWKDMCVGGIILSWILIMEWGGGGAWTGLVWLKNTGDVDVDWFRGLGARQPWST